MRTVLFTVVALVIAARGAVAQEGTACQAEPTDMIISYGDVIRCSLETSGDVDVFRFQGTAGEVVIVNGTWRAGSMRPCVTLIAPDAALYTACANSFSNPIDMTLPLTGTYTVEFSDRAGISTGDYTLTLERLVPPSVRAQGTTYGRTVSSALDPAGDLDVFWFKGRSGDHVRVRGAWVSGSMRPCVTLVAPDNTRTVSCNNAFTNDVLATLTKNGTHTVLMEDMFGWSSGSYTLVLSCLSGPCVAVPPPDVTGCISLKGAPIVRRKVTLQQPGVAVKTATTDASGCYSFAGVVSNKAMTVTIVETKVTRPVPEPPR